MRRVFVEFGPVTRALRQAGVRDESIRVIQQAIMRGAGDVISGSGGLKKIRCAAENRGKRGGVRIIFAGYPEAGLCLWIAAFAKNVRENLTRGERQGLSKLKAALDNEIRIQNRRS